MGSRRLLSMIVRHAKACGDCCKLRRLKAGWGKHILTGCGGGGWIIMHRQQPQHTCRKK